MNTTTHHQIELDKIEQAYSSEPWWYDIRGFFILTFAYRSTLWNQINLFSNNMKQNHLEVAIGSGTLLDLILKWRWICRKPDVNVLGFDYAPRMLNGARKRFKNYKRIKLEIADVTQMNFKDKEFDSINVANAIHCFPDIELAFKEINRVLSDRGTFAGNVLLHPKGGGLFSKLARRINQWGMDKGILHSPYSSEHIKSCLNKAGFQIIYSKESGNCFDFIAQRK